MPIPAGCCQINFMFSGNSLPTGAQVTLGADITTGPATPTAVGTAVNASVSSSTIVGNLAIGNDYDGCLVKFGPDATGPSALVSASISGSGVASCAPNLAYLVHKVTDDGGRAGRGRMYWPGVAEAGVDGAGNIDSSYLSAFQTDVSDLLAKLIADDIFPMVLHGDGSPITVPSEITAFTVDARAATQRRRLRR